MIRAWPTLLIVICLGGCSKEARNVGPSLPQTRPASDADPRIAAYQDNFYQMSQGGRYFSWYGCSSCHTETAKGAADLPDNRWYRGGGFAEVFGSIADGHGKLAYGSRIPVEQLWQLTAYVRDLPQHHPEKRVRVQRDAQAEPQGSTWSGPQ
jgi:cytochrome c oxidase cbb3-type subunit 3